MPEAFDEITSFPAEQVEVARMRIPLQPLLHLQSQTLHSAAHIRVTRRDPDPNARGERDHRRSARNVAVTRTAGAAPPIVTRAPPANSTTIAAAAAAR